MTSSRSTPDLRTLVSLFYSSSAALGQFTEVTVEQLPQVYRRLLGHEEHMTVTVEDFHECSVDVDVLQTRVTPTHYSRKILLRRQTDRQVVQFGIVRLNFSYLSEDVRREIESQQTPLGRILIEHNVMRHVELVSLWQVVPGSDLRQLFEIADDQTTYGRTALIYCNGEPAVELLEIVAPVQAVS